jgi:hypothetical protein
MDRGGQRSVNSSEAHRTRSRLGAGAGAGDDATSEATVECDGDGTSTVLPASSDMLIVVTQTVQTALSLGLVRRRIKLTRGHVSPLVMVGLVFGRFAGPISAAKWREQGSANGAKARHRSSKL